MVVKIHVMRLCAVGALLIVAAAAQTTGNYDALVQKGKTQLQAGTADLALASGEGAIKINANRWEAYALVGGAMMNLKRYEEAADKFSLAIEKAPEAKQAALRDLRRQCLLAESGAVPAPKEPAPAATSQGEIVLWKSIENSANPADFQSYLDQYPHGAFVVLAQRHLAETKDRADREQEQQKQYALQHGSDLVDTVWLGQTKLKCFLVHFSGDGEATASDFWYGKKKKAAAEAEADAHILAKNAFVAKYFSSSGYPMTWAIDNGILRMTASETKDRCPENFLGSRNLDLVKGTDEMPSTGTFFSGCQHWTGEFQLQLLVR
jgi:tetratricopeptide (TPR) repeat protein